MSERRKTLGENVGISGKSLATAVTMMEGISVRSRIILKRQEISETVTDK